MYASWRKGERALFTDLKVVHQQMYEIGTDHETAYDVVAEGQISTVLESLPRYLFLVIRLF